LELVTALIDAPSFDPLYRSEVIRFPARHPVYGWGCQVPGCGRPKTQFGRVELCCTHKDEWAKAREAGQNKAGFLSTATPLDALGGQEVHPCRICGHRPARRMSAERLCQAHDRSWRSHGAPAESSSAFAVWEAEQSRLPGFGQCRVAVCGDLAAFRIGLCQAHVERYRDEGQPGAARTQRGRVSKRADHPVPVHVDDQAQFQAWCKAQAPAPKNGYVYLTGLTPLVRAEIQWGLDAHAQDKRYSSWPATSIQLLANWCRINRVVSLVDADVSVLGKLPRLIGQHIRDGLRVVYFDEQRAKAAGYIETHYFGRVFGHVASRVDLTGVEVRWLRDLLWDHLAELFRSATCPRSRTPIDTLRQSCVELSAFLAIDAPGGGHNPRLLGEEHIDRFVADQRHREREGLASLGIRRKDGTPSTVTTASRRLTFNNVRKVLYTAWEKGRTTEIGLDPAFITAMPYGGTDHKPSRNPFSDEVARTLADEANLRKLDELDPFDRGVRDAWEAMVMTGRRCSEVLELRVQCIGRYSGLPLLWHDQTKVGNLEAGVRIPEPLYHRLAERRAKTITRFEHRYGRLPTADERARIALFPSTVRNPYQQESISYAFFSTCFKTWVDGLDLGDCVAYQARHTLATRLLRHGASLAHIRKHLGQVPEGLQIV